ncbi:MAG: hypothetical protein ACK5IC_04160 [Moheibacter sp.]
MNEFEYRLFLGLSIHFGGGKPAYWSGTAGVGAGYRVQFPNDGLGGQIGANATVNFYNGGLGSLPSSSKQHLDFILSGAATIGGGKGGTMSIHPFHLDSGTGMIDRFKFSGTLGTNIVFNNDKRNQQVGFAQIRVWKGSFSFYNDFDGFKKIGIADGYDRWWTGGGNFTFGSLDDDFQFIIGSDVFTADTNSDIMPNGLTAPKGYNGNYRLDTPIDPNTPQDALGDLFNAGQLDQDYLDKYRDGVSWNEQKHDFILNQGRTSLRFNTPFGQFGANSIGQGNMYPQNSIHKWTDFHLIPSTVKNSWEFSFQKGWFDE